MEKMQSRPDWVGLFESILVRPGILGDHYAAFHRYSLGNQALAVEQLMARGLEVSPIASFNAWKEKGRCVRKGQKAIALYMPVSIKARSAAAEEGDSEKGAPSSEASSDRPAQRRVFMLKNNWFAHSQTDADPGAEPSEPEPLPHISWDKDKALETLGIREESFSHVDGNIQGYAYTKLGKIAVNPMAWLPHKTRFHEIAHCILHGNEEVEMVDGASLIKCIKEAEAEATAYLCCAALNLGGLECARGYIQNWLSSDSSRELFKKSASRVFSAADKILKAGIPNQALATAA